MLTQVTDLRCEYRSNPLGLDVLEPRLSWKHEDGRRGARQSAYQVLAAGSADQLAASQGDLWDTGQVESGQSVHVAYSGRALRSRERVWWKVRAWDEAVRPGAFSPAAWWEMGLLELGDWQARWIGAGLVGGPRTSVPCPFLRRSFALEQPLASARLYVTALGLYECSLNGQRVGADELAPGWTDYRRRVRYQVYDVGGLLQPGENVLGAILGDGWYSGHVAWFGRQQYGDRPRLLAQLEIVTAAGERVTIATGAGWRTMFGPLLEADLLMGESYDARLEFPGWAAPGFDDQRWSPAETWPEPGPVLTATNGPAVRRQEELKPVAAPVETKPGDAHWIFDFGQNLVGRVRLKASGPRGATLSLRHAEVLNPDGTLYTANLRSARQIDHFTLRGGGGEETYEPRFTFHGFRYVELTGYPGRPDAGTLTAVVLHSELLVTGVFECSDPLVNQLQHNIVWGQKGNFVDVPTDCPQRDERLGWTGDAQVFIRTAAFNRDVAAFFTKWQQDLAEAQAEDGAIPPVVPNPNVMVGPDGGPAWADAVVICPWTIYQAYGDRRLLEQHYSDMSRFVDYLARTSQDFIRCYPGYAGFSGYGDWLAIGGGIGADTPKDLIGTAYFAHSARLLSHVAAVLNKSDDAGRYEQLYWDVRRAFIARYVTAQGLVSSQTQTACVLALHFDLVPAEVRPAVLAALVRDVEARGRHLSTGFAAAHYLLHVLTECGRVDLAYALLHQTTWPSWLYPVLHGATTVWERWDGWTHDRGFQDPGMNSFNHYAYGAVGDWLYGVVAGIEADPERPGYRHVILRPRPGGQISWARATYESVYGRLVSSWRLTEAGLEWQVVVPPNTTATACIPAAPTDTIFESDGPIVQAAGVRAVRRESDAAVYELEAGHYEFRAERSLRR